MAKLNSDDHKGFDLGAKLVKGGLVLLALVGSACFGKNVLNSKKGDDDEDNEASEDDQA